MRSLVLPALLALALALLPPVAHASVLSFEPPIELDTITYSQASIATDGAGTWIVIWGTTDPAYAAAGELVLVSMRSTDDARTWSTPTLLHADASTAAVSPRVEISLATDRQGTWVVVWSSSNSLGDTIGTDRDILFSRSTDDGGTWSAPQALASDAATDGSTFDSDPHVVVNPTGTWLVIWSFVGEDCGFGGVSACAWVTRSTDGGSTWQDQSLLPCGYVRWAPFTGGFKATGDANGNWIAGLRGSITRSSDDGLTWTGCEQLGPLTYEYAVAVENDGAGDWRVVFDSAEPIDGAHQDRDLLFSTSTDAGQTWTPRQLLDPENAGSSSDSLDRYLPIHDPDVIYNAANDTWLTTWRVQEKPYDTRDIDVLYSVSVGSSQSWSRPVAVNSGAAGDPTVGEFDVRTAYAGDVAVTVLRQWSSNRLVLIRSLPDCPESPTPGCKLPPLPRKSKLQIANDRAKRDQLKWKWVRGEATTASDLGDPTTTDSYLICLYDHSAGTPRLVFEKDMPAGGDCSGSPCWSVTGDAMLYKDAKRSRSAVRTLRVRAGDDGHAKISLVASGIALGPPTLPLDMDSSVVMQLINRGTGACWQADYTSSTQNEVDHFRAQTE